MRTSQTNTTPIELQEPTSPEEQIKKAIMTTLLLDEDDSDEAYRCGCGLAFSLWSNFEKWQKEEFSDPKIALASLFVAVHYIAQQTEDAMDAMVASLHSKE